MFADISHSLAALIQLAADLPGWLAAACGSRVTAAGASLALTLVRLYEGALLPLSALSQKHSHAHAQSQSWRVAHMKVVESLWRVIAGPALRLQQVRPSPIPVALVTVHISVTHSSHGYISPIAYSVLL